MSGLLNLAPGAVQLVRDWQNAKRRKTGRLAAIYTEIRKNRTALRYVMAYPGSISNPTRQDFDAVRGDLYTDLAGQRVITEIEAAYEATKGRWQVVPRRNTGSRDYPLYEQRMTGALKSIDKYLVVEGLVAESLENWIPDPPDGSCQSERALIDQVPLRFALSRDDAERWARGVSAELAALPTIPSSEVRRDDPYYAWLGEYTSHEQIAGGPFGVELQDAIEVRLDDWIAGIFAWIEGDPVARLLDLVPMTRADSCDWTPLWIVQRASHRLDDCRRRRPLR